MRFTLALSALALGVAAQANLISYYDFNDTLDAAFAANGNVGSLEFYEGQANPTPAGTPTFSSDTVGGTTKQVAQFAQNQGFFVNHGVAANGGGDYGNQYTILMDILTETRGDGAPGWMSLYNTSATNNNDGDAFIQDAGIGISSDYAGGWADNVWTRVVLSIDLTQTTGMSVYVNGNLINTVNIGPAVDGRFALYTADDGDTDSDGVWILMDNSVGETGSGSISALAFYDTALDAQAVQALGGAGEAVPEPMTMTLLGLGALAALRRKQK